MFKKKSILRVAYEKRLGRTVCDRTWRNAKSYLKIDEDVRHINLVEAYADLRQLNPYRTIRRADVERYAFVRGNLPELTCTGKELRQALEKANPQPSRATIYRWGEEIGCPFSVNKIYTPKQVQKWVMKLVSQTRFKYAAVDRSSQS